LKLSETIEILNRCYERVKKSDKTIYKSSIKLNFGLDNESENIPIKPEIFEEFGIIDIQKEKEKDIIRVFDNYDLEFKVIPISEAWEIKYQREKDLKNFIIITKREYNSDNVFYDESNRKHKKMKNLFSDICRTYINLDKNALGYYEGVEKAYFKEFIYQLRHTLFEIPVKEKKETRKKPLWEIIGNELMDKYDIITLDDSMQLMIKQSNCYNFAQKIIEGKIIDFLMQQGLASIPFYLNSTLKYIKLKTLFDRDNFLYNAWIISFKNGIWNIPEQKFIKTDKKLFYEIPFEYNPKSKTDCPNFKEALTLWLGNDNKATTDDIFEQFGYYISLSNALKTALLYYGTPNTAKTQLANILIYILGGKRNVSAISIQQMNKRFGSRGLEFKIANIYPELPTTKLFNVGIFKACTGGDLSIPAEIKGGELYSFINSARFLFTANQLATLENLNDDSFFSRWILILFPTQFKMGDPNRIDDFYKTIIDNPNEIEGIINESVKAVKRLYERKHFRLELYKDTKHIWNFMSNSVYAFIHSCCVRKTKKYILQSEFCEVFNNFCIEYNFQTLSQRAITTELKKLNIRTYQKHGESKRYYADIKWKEIIQKSL